MSTTRNHTFTPEEMDIVHQIDLPDLLNSLGYHITTKGRYQSTQEMDSLRIKDRRSWYRYSEQVGGDAITFLQHFHAMSFEEAVKHLLAFAGYSRDGPAPLKQFPPSPPSREAPAVFVLPEPAPDNGCVFAYLRKRGISKQVIDSFINAGLLYEDAQYHNCVFVGKNASDQAVFAYKRGTYDQEGFSFKGDVSGSDKSIAFRLPCDPEIDNLYVFESPVDLMSYLTLHRYVTSNCVALCCLHDGALSTYLHENPHISQIFLCLDSDKWGREAIARYKVEYGERGYEVADHSPPRGKDWNEYLQIQKHRENNKEFLR